MKKKIYLGDAVYAEVRNSELILTTEDGMSVTNTVVLGPQEWSLLQMYVNGGAS
jgi:hypothetical protein